MKQPYTYKIGWSSLDKWYYGVRVAKNCHPRDLFTTYFTSSRYVHDIILVHGLPDIIEVRKTFKTAKPALIWEQTVIRRLGAVRKEKWINKNGSGQDISEQRKKAYLDLKWMNNGLTSIRVISALVESYMKDGWVLGMGKNSVSSPLKRKKKSKETVERMTRSRRARGTSESERARLRDNMMKRNPAHGDNPVHNNAYIESQKNRRHKIYDGKRLFIDINTAAEFHGLTRDQVNYRVKKKGWSRISSKTTLTIDNDVLGP